VPARVFYNPTPGEGVVKLVCIECTMGVRDI
jgi:hypothetical protein